MTHASIVTSRSDVRHCLVGRSLDCHRMQPDVTPGARSPAGNDLEAQSPPMQESPEQRDQRRSWWRDARFGMFILELSR